MPIIYTNDPIREKNAGLTYKIFLGAKIFDDSDKISTYFGSLSCSIFFVFSEISIYTLSERPPGQFSNHWYMYDIILNSNTARKDRIVYGRVSVVR